MTRASAIAALVAASLSVAVAQNSTPPGFLEARSALGAAAKAVDKAAYGNFLADDLTWVDRAGPVQDKATVVANLIPAAAPVDTAPDVSAYDDAVVIAGKRPGTRFLQLWVKEGSRWRIVAHQGTPDGTQPVSSGPPSSKWPADVGNPADIAAIRAARTALDAGNAKADPGPFTSLTTDRFVAIGPAGVLSKQDRITAIKTSKPGPPAAADAQVSIRVHGNAAAVTSLNATRSTIATIAYVKQNGKWLRAGIIMTPVMTKQDADRGASATSVTQLAVSDADVQTMRTFAAGLGHFTSAYHRTLGRWASDVPERPRKSGCQEMVDF